MPFGPLRHAYPIHHIYELIRARAILWGILVLSPGRPQASRKHPDFLSSLRGAGSLVYQQDQVGTRVYCPRGPETPDTRHADKVTP